MICVYGKLSPYGFIKYQVPMQQIVPFFYIEGAGTWSFWTVHMVYLLEWWSNRADKSRIQIIYVGLNYSLNSIYRPVYIHATLSEAIGSMGCM